MMIARLLTAVFGALAVLFTATIGVSAGFLILATGPTLQISGTPTTTVVVNVAMTPWTAAATGGKTPYTFTDKLGALPPGVTVNSSTGVVSGTPTLSRPYNGIVIEVTDNVGNVADLAPYNLTVTPGAIATLTPGSSWAGADTIAPPAMPGEASGYGTTLASVN